MSKQFLEPQERRRLIKILANLYPFTDGGIRGRRVFIQETAGLGQLTTSSFEFSDDRGTVAGSLVGRAERADELRERPSYHCLGALLDAMLSLDELNNEDASFVASLIVRYSLIADPVYVEKLRNQYHLTEEVIRKPPAIAILPPANVGQADQSPVFEAKIDDDQALESIINSADNFLDIHLLAGASYCAQAVARVEIPEGIPKGTGFLVGRDLLLTNQHVLKEKGCLEEAVARFGYMNDASGVASVGKVVPIQPDFYFASPAEDLDYALVRLQEEPIENLATVDELREKSMAELARIGKHRGYLVLVPRLLSEYRRVNIIQHPAGNQLKVVMTQNYVVHRTDTRVQYVADTMNLSSGSPVFNERWEVVALHHSGSPCPSEPFSDAIKKTLKGKFRVNEGIPMRAILEEFKSKGIERYLPRE